MLLSLINSHLPSPHLTDLHTSPSSSLVAHTSPLASASPRHHPMAIAGGTGCRRGRRLLLLAAALLLSAASPARAFYLPGVAPRDFQKDDELQVKVNKLSSTKTQLPYDYYFLDYCKPEAIKNSAENLGEVLRGDRIENSVYNFKMRRDETCKVVCRSKLSPEAAKNFKEKIDDEYRVNMILDNLPVVVPRQTREGSQTPSFEHGYRVGYKLKDDKYYINNHLSFKVLYHEDPNSPDARIVGFHVIPSSIKHEYSAWDDKNPTVQTCNANNKITPGSHTPQDVVPEAYVVFSYDVTFEASEIIWASRWDVYLLSSDSQIHWFSIINSLMIVLFLSGMVAMIMMRTLYKDIANYNQLDNQDEAQEETGWKLVHGDVFRPPVHSGLLCVYVGTGVQFFGMTLVTMMFALLGFLSPANRGGLMTAMVLLWVFMGVLAGYTSSRLYKMFKGTEWKKITLKTAFMFPGIIFALFFFLNALIWGEKSSGAVPFGTMFALFLLWFGISVPLVFVGSFLGFKQPAIEDPVKTNKIPRQIPEQAWYLQPAFSILAGGILPFGAVFIELFFILTSIWLNQFYYIFGFLFIVFIILIVTCAEITIVLCYFQLCSEDYHWWWRAYLTAGSSALYLFAYAIFYFFNKLEITKLVSGILYFGYMLIISYAFFVLTGTIGFYACFWFVRKIYASVKID
uniref:Transmembrane 9 superfamily member n=1 Tax=Oryza meridionalis TaxID=40149 RepID=A0A0E0E300_9ORYZ